MYFVELTLCEAMFIYFYNVYVIIIDKKKNTGMS